ncbi:hypothetical protein fugu_015843 [Takifugu bimaculatus]|uniref:Uncharacterized protein n=1 Tax=Takifugu bimaculatus TaxID=433685 RepID=A0A4Z2BW18_9TELE|nr:hypothetical protein fugu_015843 [Takifugu bimaculatus]
MFQTPSLCSRRSRILEKIAGAPSTRPTKLPSAASSNGKNCCKVCGPRMVTETLYACEKHTCLQHAGSQAVASCAEQAGVTESSRLASGLNMLCFYCLTWPE